MRFAIVDLLTGKCFATYEDESLADECFDDWCNKYPDAALDIVYLGSDD
jgi:hypothetical protein